MYIGEIHGNPTLLVTLVIAFVHNHRGADKKWMEVQGEFYCELCGKHLKLDLTDLGVCGLGTVWKVGALLGAQGCVRIGGEQVHVAQNCTCVAFAYICLTESMFCFNVFVLSYIYIYIYTHK